MEVKKKRSALEMQCFQGLRVSESTLLVPGTLLIEILLKKFCYHGKISYHNKRKEFTIC